MSISVNVRKLKAFNQRPRKLRTQWTVEQGEVNVYIDAEAELTRLLSEELAKAIEGYKGNPLMSRYANRRINPKYYGKIKLG